MAFDGTYGKCIILSTGDAESNQDITSAHDMLINSTLAYWTLADYYIRRLWVTVKLDDLDSGGQTLTIGSRLQNIAGTNKYFMPEQSKTVPAGDTTAIVSFGPFIVIRPTATETRLYFTILSDNANDSAAVDIQAWVSTDAPFDESGRGDTGRWLGTAVTTSSTSTKPEVDIFSVSDDEAAANTLETQIESPLTAADVNAQCDAAIETYKLDHLVSAVESSDVVTNSIIGKMCSTDGDFSNFATTDALQSIRDKQTDIETDTNELQTDWANGGRLDLLIDAILADTGTTLDDKIDSLLQSSASLVTTVGATVTSTTVFNLTAGVANNDAYNNMSITVLDNSNSSLAETRKITDYVGATKTITVERAFSFTPQASTDVAIIHGYTSNLNSAGGTSVTYTVTDDGTAQGNAIQDVHVWVSTDSAGNTIVASGDTDSNGEVTVYLDLGSTYYFWKHKAGYTFESQPETYTVV